MNSSELLAAAEHLVGFVIVVIALSVLWGLTALMGRIFGSVGGQKAAAGPTAPASASAAAAPSTEDGDDDLIVVAAAAALMIGERHHIVSIRSAPSSWGQQGRRDIHASHRIR